jgi:phosphoribosylamine--glycine ligase
MKAIFEGKILTVLCTCMILLSGVLYGGLMKTPDGIKVIEFNARFGDPETEVVLPLLESDIYDMFEAVATGREAVQPRWRQAVTLGVVLASKGYPGSYRKGFAINNLDRVDAHVAHMGTAFKDGQLVTNGGRVLMVIAEGPTIAEAREKVYAEVAKIDCENLFYRNDIAHCAFE